MPLLVWIPLHVMPSLLSVLSEAIQSDGLSLAFITFVPISSLVYTMAD